MLARGAEISQRSAARMGWGISPGEAESILIQSFEAESYGRAKCGRRGTYAEFGGVLCIGILLKEGSCDRRVVATRTLSFFARSGGGAEAGNAVQVKRRRAVQPERRGY